ncbi:MAG: hypothetical protein WDN44_00040 [Sphingomonas sp.]
MRAAAGAIALILTLAGGMAAAQQAPDYRAADADRQAMLDRLGIREMRAGADGFRRDQPNSANYDEAKAGDYVLPDVLRLNDGRRVTTAKRWWTLRRPQIVELFDREIYGRVPATAPAIRWRMVKQETATEAGMPVVKRWLEGVADNRAWPKASATILLRYTLPAHAKGPVPVILSFGFPEGFRFPRPAAPARAGAELRGTIAHQRFRLCDGGRQLDPAGQWRIPGRRGDRHLAARQAAVADRLGRAARLGLGRRPRVRRAGARHAHRRAPHRHRGAVALRQGLAGDDGL